MALFSTDAFASHDVFSALQQEVERTNSSGLQGYVLKQEALQEMETA